MAKDTIKALSDANPQTVDAHEEITRTDIVDGSSLKRALDVAIAGAFEATFSPSGLTTQGVVRYVTATVASWTPIGTGIAPANNRNAISIRNPVEHPTPSGSTIIIQNAGSSVTNTPHDTINFDSGFVVSDNGDGSVTVSSSSAVFGANLIEAESEGVSSTTSNVYQEKLTLVTPSLPSGRYRIGWFSEASNSSTSALPLVRVRINSNVISEANDEQEDNRGWQVSSGFKYETLSGINTLDIFYAELSGGTASIRRARLELWRVS